MISNLVPRSRSPSSQQPHDLALSLAISLSWLSSSATIHIYFIRDLWPRDYFGDQKWVSLDTCLSDFHFWLFMKITREIQECPVSWALFQIYWINFWDQDLRTYGFKELTTWFWYDHWPKRLPSYFYFLNAYEYLFFRIFSPALLPSYPFFLLAGSEWQMQSFMQKYIVVPSSS